MAYLKVCFFILTSIFWTAQGMARIDLRSGNFSDSWVDLPLVDSAANLSVTRHYNNRSSNLGLFGEGWCSYLETKIEALSNTELQIVECGAGSTTHFIKNQEKFLSPNNQEYVIKNAKGYKRFYASGHSEDFEDGKLVAIHSINGHSLKLNYDEHGRVAKVISNTGKFQLQFKYAAEPLVKQIISSDGKKVSYRYRGHLLVAVSNGWNDEYTYAYDARHNLNKISYPDGRADTLVYDQKKDWPLEFHGRNGCVEKVSYTQSEKSNLVHTARDVKKCPEAEEKILEYSAELTPVDKVRARPLKETFKVGDAFTKKVYASDSGRLLSMDSSLVPSVKRSYDRKGNLQSLLQGGVFYTFGPTVNHCASQVSRQAQGDDEVLNFKYTCDVKGNIIAAQSSMGQSFALSYDGDSRLKSIKTNKGTDLQLSYGRGERQPASLSLKSVGTVHLRYHDDGEIQNISSELPTDKEERVLTTLQTFKSFFTPALMVRGDQ